MRIPLRHGPVRKGRRVTGTNSGSIGCETDDPRAIAAGRIAPRGSVERRAGEIDPHVVEQDPKLPAVLVRETHISAVEVDGGISELRPSRPRNGVHSTSERRHDGVRDRCQGAGGFGTARPQRNERRYADSHDETRIFHHRPSLNVHRQVKDSLQDRVRFLDASNIRFRPQLWDLLGNGLVNFVTQCGLRPCGRTFKRGQPHVDASGSGVPRPC